MITKATTQLKELAFRQPTQYQILCYQVCRPGLLNIQRLRELFIGDREKLGTKTNLEQILNNEPVCSITTLRIYNLLSQLTQTLRRVTVTVVGTVSCQQTE
jgi:hypothetical protein